MLKLQYVAYLDGIVRAYNIQTFGVQYTLQSKYMYDISWKNWFILIVLNEAKEASKVILAYFET